MSDIDRALQEGVWAIAATPAGKYIGQLWAINAKGATPDKNYFIDHLTNPMQMKWPLEFVANLIPRPMQAPNGQQMMGFERLLEAISISRCYDVAALTITITPSDLVFFSDMGKMDQEWHKNLVRTGIRNALNLRMKESGFVTPGPHWDRGGPDDGHA